MKEYLSDIDSSRSKGSRSKVMMENCDNNSLKGSHLFHCRPSTFQGRKVFLKQIAFFLEKKNEKGEIKIKWWTI